jgi:hypothetical protein
MAVIKPKRGSSYPASGLAENELAIDSTNRRIYIGSAGGSGITVGSHLTDYVSSVNGATGAITNVAKTDTANTFSPVQTFTNGIITPQGITFGGDGFSAIPLIGAATALAIGTGTRFNGLFSAAIGHNALANQTAFTIGNFAFGYGALQNTTSGANNTGIGNAAVSANTTGSSNVGIGNQSIGNMSSGSQNTAIGLEAGYRYGAGSNLTTVDNSVFVGYNSKAGANAGTNEIVIGHNALGQGSNTTTIGNSSTTQTFLYGRVDAEDGLSAGSGGITTSGPVTSDGGFRITSSAFNAKGINHTLLSSDNGKIITLDSDFLLSLTVPSGLPVGFNCTVIQLGTGGVGITASGTTLNSFESKLTMAGQHAAVSIISYSSNVFNVAGGLTG